MPDQALSGGSGSTLGFYGKFPVRGDFVARNLPMEFIKPWDDWLQSAVAASREQMGDDWLQTYLTSPLWRFALSPGLCGNQRWAGVMMPSVDRVGRYFPLTIVAAIHNRTGLPELLCSAASWFNQIEDLALTALDNDFELEAFEDALARLQLPGPITQVDPESAPPRNRGRGSGRKAFQVGMDESGEVSPAFERLSAMLLEKYIPSYSLWNSEGSEQVEGSLLACEGLPPVDAFSSLLDGGWRRHGWDILCERVQVFDHPTIPEPFDEPEPLPESEQATEIERMEESMHEDMHWSSYGSTDVGQKRSVNEDALLDAEKRRVWIVADGMGGHKAGDLASNMIAKSFEEFEVSENIEEAVSQISAELQQVNRILYLFAAQGFAHQVIGSTVVAMVGRGNRCGFVWAGDSRIYRLRHDQLIQLTRDHTLIDEECEAEGMDDDSESEPGQRCNVITRAVGAEPYLDLDHEIIEVEDGDTFLLCSDGLIKEVSTVEIGAMLADGTPRECVSRLMGLALERGARDNVTAIVVQTTRPPGIELNDRQGNIPQNRDETSGESQGGFA